MNKFFKLFANSISRYLTTFMIGCCVFLSFEATSLAATYYMPDDFQNLKAAVAGMQGGDTLIIRDGTYSGSDNVLTELTMPPDGSIGNFTTIRAEHDGMAIFPDGFLRMNGSIRTSYYVSFEGLKALDRTEVRNVNHYKFLRCAFFYDESPNLSSSAPFWLADASYVLVEDCWAWGAGRYRFVTGGDHVVFRRCVARFDRTDWHDPMGNFSSYTSNQTAYQNCIAIDSDQPQFWLNTEEIAGNFYIHHGSHDNIIDGCISINNRNYFAGGSPDAGFSVKNSVAVNTGRGIALRADHGLQAGYDIDHCTFININSGVYGTEGNAVDTWGGNNNSVSTISSVYYGTENIALKGYNLGGSSTGYNCLYNNNTDHYGNSPVASDYCGANSNAINPLTGNPGNGTPAILYPVRIEAGSDLSGTGLSGTDRGANILYKIGVDGTFWGDPGWDTVTSEPLWPWPNEERIRNDMRSYSYTGPTTGGTTETLSGARGFCADGQTLTKYIWEYLGNSIPPEIYGGGSVGGTTPPDDTDPPVITNVAASNIVSTSATITWTTHESAIGIVDYGLTPGYGKKAVEQVSGIAHQVVLSGLTADTVYHYAVSSRDSSGNLAATDDLTFTTLTAGGGGSEPVGSTLQNFEDGVVWQPGGSQDPSGNGRGWAFLDAGVNAAITIDSSMGANGTNKSLKVTFDSDNPQIYFRSNDKVTDHMPEAAGANRMSFYVRFPEGFPIQPLPFRYDTWQFGTYIHDPNDWSDTHRATSEVDHGIHHYYHRFTIEQVGDGWVKYIITTQPDQANYSGSTVPPDRGSEYFDNFGRFYFHFGPEASGPDPGRPFTIWIDEIKFYHDDGTVGGQIHVGGQDDAGFDGEFIPDSSRSVISPPQGFILLPPTGNPAKNND